MLEKLSTISVNNVHSLKDNFEDLLEYNAFQGYLNLCLTQTTQMGEKTVFARKEEDEIDGAVIHPHPTCFLDNNFYESFEDTDASSRAVKPVEIRSIDASWILKDEAGWKFIHALSNSDNMAYFELDSIKLLVRY
jgi:hypothetical protein